MAEQLKKIPAQISIVDLLITSEHHQEQMIEVLQKAHVKDYITPERLADLVGQIMAPRVITFSDDEIPADGTTHTHPLSILVSCRAQIVTAVARQGKGSSEKARFARVLSRACLFVYPVSRLVAP